ncbi:prolyl oligopeptidase family serine peptidase [Halolamina salina]
MAEDTPSETTDRDPPAEAIHRLPTLKHAAVAPDGSRVACYYTGSGSNEIHVLDHASGETDRWTDGEAGDTNIWPLAWGPDGERVLFHRDDADGGEAYDVFAVDRDGEVERLTDTDGSTQLRGVGPDARLLVRSSHEGGMDAYVVDDGDWTRLTDREKPVYYPILSTDGDRVALPTGEGIEVLDAAGSVVAEFRVGGDEGTATPVGWAPDGNRLLVESDASGVNRPGVLDLETGETEWFGDGEHVEEAETFLPDGRRFVASRSRDALSVPVVYDTETGESREFDLPAGVARLGKWPSRVLDGDRVLVAHATPTRPAELLSYDLASDETTPIFERDLGPFEPGMLADVTYERVPSDGVPETPQAAVEHEPGEEFAVGTLFWDGGERPSPLVVFPHGGPDLASERTFQPYVQFLCRRGYSVLQVNYRGSTGRGRAFRRALHGDWGGAEQGDIAVAVEHTLDRYSFLDEDRVAVYGGSYGGYSAAWQMVQFPDLYDAGAVVVGMTDLEAMYRETMPQFRSGFLSTYLGTPEENAELYEQRSPVTHAENVDAPLLLVHGENDPRVPVSQARIMRDRLTALGNETGPDGTVEYHELADSGHWGATDGVPEPLAIVDEFLDRRLRR